MTKQNKNNNDKKRRKHNEGSIYQLSNGRWAGSISLGYDENGKRIRKTFYGDTELDVSLQMREVNAKVGVLKRDRFKKTFCELMKEWLLVFKSTEVSSRTFSALLSIYNNHIEPFLKNLMIKIPSSPSISL